MDFDPPKFASGRRNPTCVWTLCPGTVLVLLDSENATVSLCVFGCVCVCVCVRAPNEVMSWAFLAETVENGDKYLSVAKAMHGKA